MYIVQGLMAIFPLHSPITPEYFYLCGLNENSVVKKQMIIKCWVPEIIPMQFASERCDVAICEKKINKYQLIKLNSTKISSSMGNHISYIVVNHQRNSGNLNKKLIFTERCLMSMLHQYLVCISNYTYMEWGWKGLTGTTQPGESGPSMCVKNASQGLFWQVSVFLKSSSLTITQLHRMRGQNFGLHMHIFKTKMFLKLPHLFQIRDRGWYFTI